MWEHKGVKISITSGGYFRTTLAEDKELNAASLDEIKAQIERELKAGPKPQISLPVVAIVSASRYSQKAGTIMSLTITGVNRTSRALMYSGIGKDQTASYALPDTPANRELLTHWQEANALTASLAARVEAKTIGVNGYGVIPQGKYEGLLQQLQEQYTAKSKD